MSNDLYLTPNALTSTGFPGTSLQQTITDRLTNKVLEEGQKKQTQIDSHYEARLATLNQEQDRWIKVKSSVITAQTAANNSLKGAKEIQGTLLEMRSLLARKRDLLTQETTLAASDLTIPENAQGLINVRKQLTETNTKFDTKLAKINQTANSGGKDLNLIGRVKPDFTPNTVELKADLSPVLTKLQGVNLSTSFRLVQADGKVWQADSSSNSIAQYTGLPNENKTNKTGESTSLMNGWGFGHDNGDGTVSIGGQSVLDGTGSPTGEIIVGGATVYDPTTSQMEIVVRPNTTSDYDAGGGTYSADLNDFNQPVSGTFEQAGLKMMGSWFYNGLNTTEDIDRAMVDLNKSTAT
ncbi:MAG: hypothetical protein K2Q10_00545, partial [Rhodospirillales bacterium]|nr:hypothetical protein [Rhodospirillales bacterium]